MRILFFYSHLPQKTINTMEKTEELESDLDKDKEKEKKEEEEPNILEKIIGIPLGVGIVLFLFLSPFMYIFNLYMYHFHQIFYTPCWGIVSHITAFYTLILFLLIISILTYIVKTKILQILFAISTGIPAFVFVANIFDHENLLDDQDITYKSFNYEYIVTEKKDKIISREIRYKDGTTYKGEGMNYYDDEGGYDGWEKHGKGKFYRPNGTYRTETWKDGELVSASKWLPSK